MQIVQPFENFIQQNLPASPSFHPHYEEALAYMLKAKGKRFRPYLLLSLVNHYAPLLLKNAYYPAYGLELLHTYSLIHDDLPAMDNSALRRGMSTLHVKYDEVSAILVGDALNTHAFYIISIAPLNDSVKVKLVQTLAQNGGVSGMVLGQAIDCEFENKKIDFEKLKFLHVNKTAKLIAASLKMGAIISNLDENLTQKWYDFGINLGIAFQIHDDILDALCDDVEVGKPTKNDENKNTYISVLGLQKAKDEEQKLIKQLHVNLEEFDKPIKEEFANMLNKYFKRG